MLVFLNKKKLTRVNTGCNVYFRFTKNKNKWITEHHLVPVQTIRQTADKHFNIYSQLHTGVNQENRLAQTTLTKSVQENKRSPLLFRASLFSTGLLPRKSIKREREKEKHERERSQGGELYNKPQKTFPWMSTRSGTHPKFWTSIFSLCNAEDNLDSHSIMSSP